MRTNISTYIKKDGTQNIQYLRSVAHIHNDKGNLSSHTIKKLLSMTYGTLEPDMIETINKRNRNLIKNVPVEEEEPVEIIFNQTDNEVTGKPFNPLNVSDDQEYVNINGLKVKVTSQVDDEGNKYFNILLKLKQ